jgi:dTDP-glucose 4,6-dehydratase
MGKVGNLRRLEGRQVRCVWHDLRSPIGRSTQREIGEITDIVHMAAETHVDRSIAEPIPFVEANVLGTAHLLEYAREIKLPGRFIQFSTDEVFGPAPEGQTYGEEDFPHARNPYAATKAGAEQLLLAWCNTYGLHGSIVRSMNVFGEYQDAEKFIPKVIGKVLRGETVTIHADKSLQKAGSRFYIHADDVAGGVREVLRKGEDLRAYHIVGEKEIDNLSLAEQIAKIMDKPLHYKMVDFHSSRPGHDLRYALADTNMITLGWQRKLGFQKALKRTVNWYLEHKEWL